MRLRLEESWNPVTGCTPVSEGCANCHARRMAQRLRGRRGYPQDEPFRVTLHEDRLDMPLRWRKPRLVFVCSMGDLFHEQVPDTYILQVWNRFLGAPQHTYLVLTKRPERMRKWLRKRPPLPNVWLGVSAENQRWFDARVSVLSYITAAVRFVSLEPLLGPVMLGRWHQNGPHRWHRRRPHLGWVIAGSETGPGARPAHLEWFRSIRDECAAYGVPFFLKQTGSRPGVDRLLDGRVWDEMPVRWGKGE